MAPTIEQLRGKTTDQLIREHDAAATHTVVGISYYLEEIARREQAEQTHTMLQYTKQVRTMTVIVTVATIINVLVTAVLLFK